MRTSRGLTLLELVIAIAIIAILAAGSYGYSQAGARNASVGAAVFDLSLRAQSIRSLAMASGQEHLLVVADAPANDASGCTTFSTATCAKYFLLRQPTTTWTGATLATFDVAAPGSCAGGRRCLAIRYTASGRVEAVGVPPAPGGPTAVSFAFQTNLVDGSVGDRKGIVIGFPSGLSKTFSF